MSFGERSCTAFGNCVFKPTTLNCNVNCPGYKWDNITKPDSEPARVDYMNYMKVTYKTKKKRR